MRTIALEEHFLSRGVREVMQSRASSQAGGSNPVMTAERLAKLADLDTLRLQDMDTGGIDLQVLSDAGSSMVSCPGEEGIKLARESNDQLAEACAAHPDRFAGFATLPMTEPEAAADELERTVRQLGLKGPMIFGTSNGRFLDDPSFLPVLERAAALSVPMYLHPAIPPLPVREAYYSNLDPTVGFVLSVGGWGWHSEVGIHALRLILAGVFDRLPALQIIIGHMGEMIPFMLPRINDTLTPVAKYLQRPVPEYFLHNFHITTSGFFTDPLLLLALQVVGADRILFAVDYPFSMNEQGRAFLDHASISPADKEKISHLNAERLLRLEADRFILHIALRSQWEQAKDQGTYRGDTLESEGFLHCSNGNQVLPVANTLFRGRHDLVLLLIQTSRVMSPIKYEGTTSELYPHIYGPLNCDAVIAAYDFLPGEQGEFHLPEEVTRRIGVS